MAKPHAMSRRVEVRIDRERVTVDEFIAALRDVTDLVGEVSANMFGATLAGAPWVIRELRSGSAVAVLEAAVSAADVPRMGRVLETTAKGLAGISRRATRPRHFSDKALHLAAALSTRLTASEGGAATVRIGTTNFRPSPNVVAHVETITAGRTKSIGSIEGRLVGIEERGRIEVYVEEPVQHHRVRCRLPDSLVDLALRSFRRRVYVQGVIWETAEGFPKVIEVRELEPFPDTSDLPTAADVRGILRRG